MAAANRQGKMANYVGYRMRITLNDQRTLVGQMMAFDKHMNLVLTDCEEFRRVSRKVPSKTGGQPETIEHEDKRALGMLILRGSNVVGCSVEGPPPAEPASRLGDDSKNRLVQPMSTMQGPGTARPMGRGMPAGLSGPAAGVGGPGPVPGFAPPGMGFPPGGAPPGFPGRGGPPGMPGGMGPGGMPMGPGSMPPFGQGPPGGPPGFPGSGFPPPGRR